LLIGFRKGPQVPSSPYIYIRGHRLPIIPQP
jgi:hypothetical protein